ncbi:MAG: mandelate racemase/muconate lactonizing enzyme family protein [Acidobacteria bacterium]|nr:MAG: mandelate racemase/muconate lactonizing enzyme family protein [Acidobacteriota bacterium]
MKITDIEAIHLRVEDPNIGLFDGSYDDCVVRVRTDEGLTGIGEVESLAPAIQAIISAAPAHNHARGLRELLVGRDPSSPEELWDLMYDATDYVGRRGLVMHAIGGIDLALWDIKGQLENKPIAELLGGAHRDRLEAYGTIYPMARTVSGVEAQVEDALNRLRLRNIKFAADPWWMDDLDQTARLLEAARRVLGNERGMIVDSALSYRTADEGLRLVPILKEVGVMFLEAPLPLDDVVGHARMAAAGLPLGVGDLGLTHVDEFIEAMDRGQASICQPDITMVGGFTGIRKIANAARERHKRVITHGYKTNIEIAANLHFLANHWTAELLEYSTSKSPLRWEVTEERLEVSAGGTVHVPRSPGLGVHLDERAVEKYRVR